MVFFRKKKLLNGALLPAFNFNFESIKVKIVKIIKAQRNASEDEIKSFIYRNLSQEMINGLEYDDPKTISRALRLFGIDPKAVNPEEKETKNLEIRSSSSKET